MRPWVLSPATWTSTSPHTPANLVLIDLNLISFFKFLDQAAILFSKGPANQVLLRAREKEMRYKSESGVDGQLIGYFSYLS